MLKLLALLGLSTLLWWSALWLLIPVHWQQLSPTVMLLLHLLPPIMLTVLVQLWRLRQQRQEQTAAQAQADAEAAAQQERRDAARTQHQAALHERQQTIACRWLWGQALPQRDEPVWLAALPDACQWSVLTAEEVAEGAVLDSLQASVADALLALYGELPGAAALPLLLEVLPQISGIEQVGRMRELQQQAWFSAQGDAPQPDSDCRFLPGSGALAERVLSFLAQDPALPGVVVLAADAPRALLDADEEPDSHTRQQWRQLGHPGAAVVLMLFLREGLLAAEGHAPAAGADPYQPYWERSATAIPAGWGPVPASAQATLSALPVLACLAPSSGTALAQQGTLQLTRQLQALLDNALVNAALLDYPFSEEDARPQDNQADSVAWLVHNSGDVEVGGARLSAIASNLTRHQIALHPIDEACNLVRDWGDVGAATSAMLAALAVTHCARLAAPAVITQFHHDHAALAVARPACKENTL